MKDMLIIIGASGHGKVVADIAMNVNKWSNIVFLDDNESIKTSMGLEVIGKVADALHYKEEADFFVAIGNNATRKKVLEKLIAEGLSVVSLIHPTAIIGSDVDIDIGTVIMAGVVINCCSSIGKGCIINTGAIVEHDNIIEDYVHISPGVKLAGSVTISQGAWLGIGSVVSNNVSICQDTIIGAGAVVTDNISHGGVFVGIPARRTSP